MKILLIIYLSGIVAVALSSVVQNILFTNGSPKEVRNPIWSRVDWGLLWHVGFASWVAVVIMWTSFPEAYRWHKKFNRDMKKLIDATKK